MEGTSKVTALAALLGLLAGCAGTTASEPSGQVDSGLPEDQPINELSAEEADQICDAEVVAWNERLLELGPCALRAWSDAAAAAFETDMDDADVRQLCADAYQLCTEQAEPGDFRTDECMLTDAPPASCQATVGQLEACWTDDIHEVMKPPPSDCASMTRAEGDAFIEAATVPRKQTPACKAFYAACPTGISR